MRILITGGTGLIGTALATELVRHGHEVIALSRSDLVDEERLRELKAELAEATGAIPYPISAPLNEGVEALLDKLIERLGPEAEPAEETADGERPWSPL